MQDAISKYKDNPTSRAAILHLIGQSVHVFKQYPTIADVAVWMNVCKRTAAKYLARMNEENLVYRVKSPYRAKFKYVFSLSDETWQLYHNGAFVDYYRIYAARTLGVIVW